VIVRGGRPVAGFALGDAGTGELGTVAVPVAAAVSPWTMALATSVLGAATGWAIEELASNLRGRRRR
jgi:membrane protein YqaA with SNARE-associated domain